MKKTFFLFMITALSVSLFSCSSSNPVDVAKGFSSKIAAGDFEGAKEFASKPTCAMLEMAAAMGANETDANYEFNFVKDSVVGDEAWVIYKNKVGKECTVSLTKEDGKWKAQPNF